MSLVDTIKLAYSVAAKQKEDREKENEKHLDEICEEVFRLLQKQIDGGHINDGYVMISSDTYRASFCNNEIDGYCGWNRNIFVWDFEGSIIAKRISYEYGVKCTYFNKKFIFDFN